MENLINQEIIFELSDINKTLVCRDNKENIWFINNKVFKDIYYSVDTIIFILYNKNKLRDKNI